MRFEWGLDAQRMRDEAVAFLAGRSSRAALLLERRLFQVSRALADNPYLGRPSRVAGLREFVVTPSYRLVYVVGVEIVLVIALLHTSQDWPPRD